MKAPAEVAAKETMLHDLWPRFTEALNTPHLTRAHATFIAENVAKNLIARLQAMETGTRSR